MLNQEAVQILGNNVLPCTVFKIGQAVDKYDESIDFIS